MYDLVFQQAACGSFPLEHYPCCARCNQPP